MSSKKCPNCGLWNVETAIQCDCCYDFKTGEINLDSEFATARLEALNAEERKTKIKILSAVLITLVLLVLFWLFMEFVSNLTFGI